MATPAEAAAARLAAARAVGAVEAVEQVREVLGLDADAGVGDLDHDR